MILFTPVEDYGRIWKEEEIEEDNISPSAAKVEFDNTLENLTSGKATGMDDAVQKF